MITIIGTFQWFSDIGKNALLHHRLRVLAERKEHIETQLHETSTLSVELDARRRARVVEIKARMIALQE